MRNEQLLQESTDPSNPAAPLKPASLKIASERLVVPGINENILRIYRGGRITPQTVMPNFVVVRRDGPWVLLALNDKVCQLTTTQAHDSACAMMYLLAECEPMEFVVMEVNGESYNFPHEKAEALCKGLLRKADHVDDFQLQHRVRILR